jgi:hypothetical protein
MDTTKLQSQSCSCCQPEAIACGRFIVSSQCEPGQRNTCPNHRKQERPIRKEKAAPDPGAYVSGIGRDWASRGGGQHEGILTLRLFAGLGPSMESRILLTFNTEKLLANQQSLQALSPHFISVKFLFSVTRGYCHRFAVREILVEGHRTRAEADFWK